jgi:hypothetical protein
VRRQFGRETGEGAMRRFFNDDVIFGLILGVGSSLLAIAVAAIGGLLPTQTIVEYVDHWSGLFTALFTLGLFIATILLWMSTRRAGEEQIAQLRASSERQLRAYVYLENAYFKDGAEGWEIKYKIKNFGQTPAHSVRTSEIAQVVNWEGPSTQIPTPHLEPIMLGSMAPMGDYFENDADLEGVATLEEIQSGVKAIYLRWDDHLFRCVLRSAHHPLPVLHWR